MAANPGIRLAQLSAAGALAYCSYAMCRSPALPLFARELGASHAVVGVVVAASTMTGVVLKFPAGALSDVVGRRLILLSGAAVFAVLPLGYLAAAGLAGLVTLRVIHGSATALFGPAASAALSDLAPPEQRGQWLSLYSATQGAGQALGPVLAASLIVGGDFSAVFVVGALVGGFALALLVRWPPTTARAPAGAVWSRLRDGLHATAADTRVLVTSVAQAGQFFVNGTLAAFLPLYARESLGLAPWRIGWVFGLQTAATLVARPLFGLLSDRVGRRPLIVGGLTTCAACMAAIPYADDFTSLVAVTMVYGTGLAITTSATSAYVTDLTRRARYGAAHGLFGTIYDIGDALGPICAGLVVARTGYVSAFQWSGVVAITIALTFARVSRRWDVTDRTLHQGPLESSSSEPREF